MSKFSHTRVVLHVDMDAFFAAIEQRDTPSFQGKPVIVGAEPGRRGVVSAASYEAREFGIHSAMPIGEAYARCPSGVFVRPRGEVYAEESRAVMQILDSFSPYVEQVSVDEAFVDISGTRKLWGAPGEVARKISARILAERHLTASIGIAPNKFLAKIASDFQKPSGITEVPFDQEEVMRWLAPFPVGKMWGIGAKSQVALSRLGIRTVGDLQSLSLEVLQERFGKSGVQYYYLCRGVDQRPVEYREPAKSISREYTFNSDCSDPVSWKRTLLALSRDVAYRARVDGVQGTTVVLSFRLSDFSRHSRRCTLSGPTDSAVEIHSRAIGLLEKAITTDTPLRLIGVGLTGFGKSLQTNLFGIPERAQNWKASEKAMDKLTRKYGKATVVFAGEMGYRRHDP